MRPRFDYGAKVRVVRNLRNDGTFPGLPRGALLVRRGSVGHVLDVGTFLQDQVVYSVRFLAADRIVGCRDEELIGAQEPWTPSRFETRERVLTRAHLSLDGAVVAPAGTEGEVMRVLRETPDGVQYHVHFPGHVLQVPEALLEAIAGEAVADA